MSEEARDTQPRVGRVMGALLLVMLLASLEVRGHDSADVDEATELPSRDVPAAA